MNGRATAVRLHIDKDGSYWVLDNGTGIPQGIKQIPMHVNGKDIINKLPTMQAVFGELHTSGKYRADAYKVSIGTHGIGSKGTNATSEYFDVVTMFKGKWYTVGFKKGKLTTPVKQLAKAPKGPDGKALVKGTCIHFKPDTSIFSAKSFPLRMATEWSETMSYLNKGFAIIISSSDGKKKTYLSKRGPLDYIDNRVLALKTKQLSDKIFEFHSSLADVVVSFTNCEGSDLRGFTMGLFNPDGGTHVKSTTDALFTGLVTALNSMGKGKLVSTSIKVYNVIASFNSTGNLGLNAASPFTKTRLPADVTITLSYLAR
jgi:DNA gyrase/topoisomerase IV subunit B